MIENVLREKLRKVAVQVCLMCAALLVCAGALFVHLRSIQNAAVQSQVIAETDEYRSRILKQLRAGYQLLSTLSAFLEAPESEEDWESMAQCLKAANQNNDFLTMAFYDRDLRGVICTANQEPLMDAGLADLSSEGQASVMLAMEGEAVVSRLFESTISRQRVFAYSVPVCAEDQVVGVLSATDHIDIFSDILSGNTVLGGSGYIHLIGSDGSFMVRSPNTVVQEVLPSIYDGPYLSDSSAQAVRSAMQRQERVFSSFTYEGREYPFLLEPVGLNGWYLFCVNTGEGLAELSDGANLTIGGIFGVMLLLIVYLILRGCRLLGNYNRDLRRLAYSDPLTGAENMTRFQQRLVEAVGTTGGSAAALSIRQFPFITEIFGREQANQLLCEIRETIGRHLRASEFFCRDSGDLFYIFFRDTEPDVLRPRLSALLSSLEQGTQISKTNYRLAFYCGAAPSPVSKEPEADADRLLTSVLFALDRAKGGHASTVWFFDTELHKKEELENYIESHMHQALRDGEFLLFLQPKKDLRSGKLAGAEALVRWKTAGGRMIFPDQFIPLFERNGFCVQLDLYMVERACQQLRSWIDRGAEPIPISVNQSKLLFFEPHYVRTLKALIQTYDVPARLITLEILEGLALENAQALNEKIVQLQSEGFRVSLDDFGSGFSSLNTLGSLQIDELKLDRGFLMSVSALGQKRARLIMRQTVQIAKQLSISTVAEGVETKEDESLIREIGCDIGQGYLYSRPLSAEDFDRLFIREPGGGF